MTGLDSLPICSRLVDAVNGNYGDFMSPGACASELIFRSARWLRYEEVPGLVSIFLVVVLAILMVHVGVRERRNIAALPTLMREEKESKVEADGSGPVGKQSFLDVSREVSQKMKERREVNHRDYVAVAWDEFRETLVLDETENPPVLRNSVRPSSFFNVEDLHFGPGIYRYAPGIFVSFGLFLTFLGLISALRAIEGSLSIEATPDEMRVALNDLLRAASAKFIMSLTGLLASIAFTIHLRRSMARVERAVHQFCFALEKELSFVSLEEKVMEQIALARSSKDDLQRIGNDLVERFGQVLEDKMADLGGTISEGVGEALTEASKRLLEAADKIGSISGNMGKSAEVINEKMKEGVTELVNATKDLTGQLSESADKMVKSANKFHEELDASLKSGAAKAQEKFEEFGKDVDKEGVKISEGISGVFKRIAEEMEAAAEKFSAGLSEEMLRPLKDLATQFGELASKIESGAKQIDVASSNMRAGGEESRKGAEMISSASRDLQEATGPIRESVEKMETSVENLSSSAQKTSETIIQSAKEMAKNLAGILNTAHEALGGEQKALHATFLGLQDLLKRMEGQWENADEMDRKLGAAFQKFTGEVEKANANLTAHVRTTIELLAPLVDAFRKLLEDVEKFKLEKEENERS